MNHNPTPPDAALLNFAYAGTPPTTLAEVVGEVIASGVRDCASISGYQRTVSGAPDPFTAIGLSHDEVDLCNRSDPEDRRTIVDAISR